MPSRNDEKNTLRAQAKKWRENLGADERARIDAGIVRHVAELAEWQNAEVVLAYLSFGCEVETRALIEAAWAAGKTVALPRCVAGTRLLEWHRAESFDGLKRSALGVDEPRSNPETLIDATTLAPARTVALVPGLAFDEHGFRLGYGGGFYDTFLAQFAGASIGLCRAGQLHDSLVAKKAVDGHDEPVALVVTEKGVLRHPTPQHAPTSNRENKAANNGDNLSDSAISPP